MFILVVAGLVHFALCTEPLISVTPSDYSTAEKSFLLYDINHGEGFNLRRDVYMRVANAVRLLRENGHNYVLVLPPWGGLYHWQKQETKLPWSLFFDVQSLNEFVPVIEFEDFLRETNNDAIDIVLYLQRYKEDWTPGNYEMKFDKRDCLEGDNYYRFEHGRWRGWFYSYQNVWARNFTCISMQGDSTTLVKLVESDYLNFNSLFIDRAETILHSVFGDKYYWEVRRSMRYSKHLTQMGDDFRKEKLNSVDTKDQTILSKSWKEVERKHGDAKGGDFICVHWRRRDFVRSHNKNIPSIEGAAKQISRLLTAHNLSTVFLSTDAVESEVNSLKDLLPPRVRMERFIPDDSLSDGETSVVDQWICAHARYFIGTHVSTFSYRIQEDREILGFLPETTFNRLCPDDDDNCEQPAKWRIVYKDNEPLY